MKNPPGGGHRASRSALTGKVDLGLSEIVEGGASTRFGSALDRGTTQRPEVALDGNRPGVSPVAIIDLDAGININAGTSSRASNVSAYSKTLDVFHDAEIHLQSSLTGASDHSQKSSQQPLRSPVVEGPDSEKGIRKLSNSSFLNDRARDDSLPMESEHLITAQHQARRSKKSWWGLRWLLLGAIFATGISALSYDKFSSLFNLAGQMPFLSHSDEVQVFPFRSLGISFDSGSSMATKQFITYQLDSTPLSVSELDAVAYKMQKDDGEGVMGGAVSNPGAPSSTNEQGSGSAKGASKGEVILAERNRAEINRAKRGQGERIQDDGEVVRRDSSTRQGVKGNNRPRVEINTSGPLEPRLPERESPSVTEEFRDPFARESISPSISPSPKFPKGNEVRPIMEEPFTQEKILKVQGDTTVRSKPSVFGEELANLRTGDSVLAVSKVGEWVRVRSKKGLSGFVLEKALAGE